MAVKFVQYLKLVYWSLSGGFVQLVAAILVLFFYSALDVFPMSPRSSIRTPCSLAARPIPYPVPTIPLTVSHPRFP